MKKKTKSLNTFLAQVKHAIDLREDEQQMKLNELVKRWRTIIPSLHSGPGKNHLKAFRNLHHLKLRIQWLEKTTNAKKKTNESLTLFFYQLNEYVDVEIKCMRLERMKLTSDLSRIKLPKKTKLRWTASKRALVELIYAIKQIGCMNDGKVTLKELIDRFSILLNIDLSNFHSTAKRLTERNLNKYQSRAFFWMNLETN